MNRLPALALLAALVAITGCEQKETRAPQEAQAPQESPQADVATPETKVVMKLPVTTSSDVARDHFYLGLHALDMGRLNEANAQFEKAVGTDPKFASGYLQTALSAASTEEFATNLAVAGKHAAGASKAEQLLIEAWQKGFENNTEAQLAAGQELTQLLPDSPRAWLALAGFQSGANKIADSRKSLVEAIELEPGFAAAHMQAGNNYLFLEPKNFDQAEQHFRKAIELAPDEPNPHDLMGDVHRAQGNLEAAYNDYTKAARLAPDLGSPLQQRGHVNSFLGKYDEARADYTRSMELEMARGNNTAPFFEVFRAYVSVHENKPKAAITELREISKRADTSGLDGKLDVKINALTNVAQIATHYGDFEAAEATIREVAALMRQQADDVGKPEFRRAQEATIAYWEGMLAARQGNGEAARAKAEEFARIVAPDPNPRKLERMHEIMGMADFYQENYSDAAGHLVQGNPTNAYIKYFRAISNAEAGNMAKANKMLQELAVLNFNGLGYAMTRADILKRVSNI